MKTYIMVIKKGKKNMSRKHKSHVIFTTNNQVEGKFIKLTLC